MPIPTKHAGRHAYHFTHLDNLEDVLTHGFLSCNLQKKRSVTHHSIALSTIQDRRARMAVPCGPRGVVHDYVPLYFSKLSPMLLQIVSAKNVDQMMLIHFAFPITLLDRPDVVFTGAAANSTEPPPFYDDPARLADLDWNAIDRTKWKSESEEQKHARMAEVLVHNSLSPTNAAYILVWNDGIKGKVRDVYKKAGMSPPSLLPIDHDGLHSYTHFKKGLPDDMLRRSIAPGPQETKSGFTEVVTNITKGKAARAPRFATLSALLKEFHRSGLSALPETAELIGLDSENEVHKEDVGTHTLTVVKKLLASSEYKALDPNARILVEVAAYLHDIGKGPKSRWFGCDGKQQVDAAHPLRSGEMLERILLEEVAKLDAEVVRELSMLVCYHDLIGDIVGKGRKREQILGVALNERQLDMLIALGKADMTSVTSAWGWGPAAKIPELKDWAVSEIGLADADESTDDDSDEDD